MKRQPLVTFTKPDPEQARKIGILNRRIDAHVGKHVAACVSECDFAGDAQLGRALAEAGRKLIERGEDSAAAATWFSATSGRKYPSLPPGPSTTAAQRYSQRSGGGEND